MRRSHPRLPSTLAADRSLVALARRASAAGEGSAMRLVATARVRDSLILRTVRLAQPAAARPASDVARTR